MSRKKQGIPNSGAVWRLSSEKATLNKMPKYNAFQGKSGPHGDMKYNRARERRNFRQGLDSADL